MKKNLDISVVIPVFNEEESLVELNNQILNSIDKSKTYELIYINDGSTDQSKNILSTLASKNSNIKLINFYKNKGKADALNSGFYFSSGKIVITLDSDLQDDPNEFQKLVKEIDNGYDMVSGWKKNRKDPISKRFPSKIFNFFTRFFSGIKIHDFNCGLKVYKKKVVKSIDIYGGMHRYIPVIAKQKGFTTSEKPVHHRSRQFGETKYGSGRFLHGFFDLITILFLNKFTQQPLHLFGSFGIIFFSAGFMVECFVLYYKYVLFEPFSRHMALLTFGVMLIVIGIQFFSIGLLGELMAKANHNQENRIKYSKDDNQLINKD